MVWCWLWPSRLIWGLSRVRIEYPLIYLNYFVVFDRIILPSQSKHKYKKPTKIIKCTKRV